jgi:hypothetical protein
LGERLNGIQEVRGSTPLGSTNSLGLILDYFACYRHPARELAAQATTARPPAPYPASNIQGRMNGFVARLRLRTS